MSADVSYVPVEAAPTWSASRVWAWVVEHRLFVIAFVGVLLLGIFLRILTLDRYLPFIDFSAEVVHLNLAQHVRQLPDAPYMVELYTDPTFYGYFNAAVQVIYETLNPREWHMAGEYLYALRIASVIVGTLTIGVMATIGWQIGGYWAAWFATFLWATCPILIENNNFALPDAFIFFFTAITLSTSIRAWHTGSPRWLLVALISGILVIYSKYWIAPAVVPFMIVAVVLFLRRPLKMLPWMVVYAVIAGVSAWYLLGVLNPLTASSSAPELSRFQKDGLAFALSLDRNFNNLWWAVYPLGAPVFYIIIAGGIVAWWYNRRNARRTVNLSIIALLLVYSLATNVMASSWTNVYIEKIRHTIPITIALIIVWAAALAQIIWALSEWVRQQESTPNNRLRYVPFIVPTLAVIALTPRYAAETWQTVQSYKLPSSTEVFWHYTDINVPNDGLILMDAGSGAEKTWNRAWSGYDGVKSFQWWFEDAEVFTQTPPLDYVERGILYFAMSDIDDRLVFNPHRIDPEPFLSQLTLIKHIPAGDDMVGDGMWLYRMIPPDVAADVDFGGQIILTGYDLDDSAANPGGALVFRPYWRVDQRPSTNYSMFIHLYPADEDHIVAQYDGAPTTPDRLTLTWDDPDELYIGPDVTLALPADLAPGSYRLAVGLYDFTGGGRLSTPDGATYTTVPVTVEN